MNRRFILIFWVAVSLAMPATAQDVVVEALLPGIAVLQIDRQRVTLRAGQSHQGVRLIEADAGSALLDVAGETRRLGVSQRISASFSKPAERSIAIPLDAQMQYRTTAEINGVRMPVIVDTGANIVALNMDQARAAGIAVDEGEPVQLQTAGAVITARRVLLDSVSVAGIHINAVEATVVPGQNPAVALLGMSFLRHVELEEKAGVLTLRGRW